ncbi:hypothetical protein GLW05_04565 [Pontibacillus yanchengensis]|uniref:WWE domain-containing protein n=1 Tax=Pontibacillus yanchengensis TaxID=462910 RepID=A0A6I4ZVU2_9BACI|nr:hypothetical protein [Pontibacillus yanchengensis]MYL32866.1 hypothetical protein [Pontibacillus yanchengensis]
MNPFIIKEQLTSRLGVHWSLWAIPGFEQLYNRKYLLGLFYMIWEVVVNLLANLHLSIIYSFRGDLQASYDVVKWEWALFYPSVYAYGIWQAYNTSSRTNYE